MRFRALFAALVLLPTLVFAQEPHYGNPYEETCRNELHIPTGEIAPGVTRSKLRDCMREKAAQIRRKSRSPRVRSSVSEKQEAVGERELKRQEENLKQGKTSTFMKNVHEDACRKKMGLTGITVPPGPILGQLRRCINRESAAAAKAARSEKKRQTVRERQEALHKKILQKEIGKEVEESKKRSEAVRTRLIRQSKAPSSRFKNIRDANRVRIDFSRPRAADSRTVQRNKAMQCRRVSASKWAECIRKALSDEYAEDNTETE